MSAQSLGIDHDGLVKLVSEATENVFTTMLGQTIVIGPAYMDTTTPFLGNGVVSFIGLAGEWTGTGSLACDAACACRIATQLMMAEYAAVDDDVLDAFAEVTNMIIGNVKTTLEDRLGPMGLSIPTVIYGRNFSTRTVGKQEWTVVPFECDGGRLEVQLCLAERAPTKARLAMAAMTAACPI